MEEDDSDPEQSAASGFVVADGHLSDSEGFQDPEELDTELEGACYLIDDCTPSKGAWGQQQMPGQCMLKLSSSGCLAYYLQHV